MKGWSLGGKWGLGLLVTLVATFAQANPRDLDFDIKPLFEGKSEPRFISPYLVTAANRGPDARGAVIIRAQSFSMRYPIELPRGTQKQFVVYPVREEYSMTPMQFLLDTDQGSLRYERQMTYSESGWLALGVSDVSGVISSFAQSDNYAISMTDAYARPGRMPDRAAGYAGCAVVVLGEGAERMSDAECRALQGYVLLGGSVILMGGPSATLLQDERWQNWLPIQPAKPVTIDATGIEVVGLKPAGKFTITPGQPTPGSAVMHRYGSQPFVVKKSVGMGRVIYIAANLLEEPGRTWDGLAKFYTSFGFVQGANDSASFLGLADRYDSYGGYSTYPASYSTSPTAPTGSLDNDPFQAKMPPTGTILLILGIYFVLVVPVNLLVLRKMGKGELAWVTSPIISLAFAAIFFRFAAGLYSAELSNATDGTWVVDEASVDGYFVGQSQIFFPRGGQYDLGLEGVEYIGDRSSRYGEGGKLFNDLRAVDEGQIKVRQMAVNNLSFHEFGFQQRVEGGKWFVVGADGKSVTNRSKFTVVNVLLSLDGKSINIGELKPGETRQIGALQAGDPLIRSNLQRTSAARFMVTGQVQGFRPGPQIGNVVPAYHRINLFAFGIKEGAK